jgi:hypothetical protein
MVEYIVEIALSAIAILVFAVDRFNTPPTDPKAAMIPHRTSRSTTTAASYYTAVSLYGAIALGVFAFLLLSPQAVDRLVASAPEIRDGIPAWARQSPPLLLALILTVLLPKIPVLSAVDRWFRTRLQRMAAIPHEVRRLAAELRRVPFRASAERQQEMVRALVDRGFDVADLRFEEGSAPHYLWTKLSLVVHELDGWEADARVSAYVLTYPNEFNALRQRYEVLLEKARTCFRLLREAATDPEHAKKAGAVYAYRDGFVEDVKGLLKHAYEAISHAVLLCEFTQRARANQLIKLGFGVDPEPPRRLTLNQLLGLFTGISVVFAFGFIVSRGMRQPGAQIDFEVFVRAVMIAAIYCVAVWCGIYPKTRWSVARRHPEHGRPWGWYLLSGVTAAAAGALISYAFKVATRHGDLAKAWELYWQVSPWGVMTFATAYGVAFLADDEPRDGFMGLLTAARLRWVEGLGLTVGMAAIAWLVHRLLLGMNEAARSLHAADPSVQVLPVRPLGEVLVFTVVIGFAIGALVLSWYRGTLLAPHREGRARAAATASAGRA